MSGFPPQERSEVAAPASRSLTACDDLPSRQALLEVLKTVDDPELGVDIVNLGLVRQVEVQPHGLHVAMTLTSSACPMGTWLQSEVIRTLEAHFPEHGPVSVEVRTSPPWRREDMSAAARELLGIPS